MEVHCKIGPYCCGKVYCNCSCDNCRTQAVESRPLDPKVIADVTAMSRPQMIEQLVRRGVIFPGRRELLSWPKAELVNLTLSTMRENAR